MDSFYIRSSFKRRATSLALFHAIITLVCRLHIYALSRCLKLGGILRPCPFKLLLLLRPVRQRPVLAVHALQLLLELCSLFLLTQQRIQYDEICNCIGIVRI